MAPGRCLARRTKGAAEIERRNSLRWDDLWCFGVIGWVTGIRTDRPRVVGSDFMNLSRLSAIRPE